MLLHQPTLFFHILLLVVVLWACGRRFEIGQSIDQKCVSEDERSATFPDQREQPHIAMTSGGLPRRRYSSGIPGNFSCVGTAEEEVENYYQRREGGEGEGGGVRNDVKVGRRSADTLSTGGF